uniref:Uncharacterized protein n=1 Tax=Desertifilum tharense IPPAS B-1220 TaxID=1781255 RepID=A0ACD5GPW5_9CYAN
MDSTSQTPQHGPIIPTSPYSFPLNTVFPLRTLSPISPPPHPPTLLPTQHSALYTQHSETHSALKYAVYRSS